MLATSRQFFPVCSSASTQDSDCYDVTELPAVVFMWRSYSFSEAPQNLCVQMDSSTEQTEISPTDLNNLKSVAAPAEETSVDSAKRYEKSDRWHKPVVDSMQATEIPCVKPKYGSKIIGLPEENIKYKRKPKKKRWKKVEPTDMGFRLSLFPRVPVVVDENDMQQEADCLSAVLEEMNDTEEKVRPFCSLLRLEGSSSTKDKLVRKDSNRREVKAHKQIKTKNITSLLNNHGRKTLYIHFRIYKMHPFLHCSAHCHPNLPQPPKKEGVCLEVAKSIMKAEAKLATSVNRSIRRSRPPPPQNPSHELHSGNASSDLPVDVLSFFINLQHREMTPEDYEMLLMLDESVAPKTLDESALCCFQTDVVSEVTAGDICSVCIEPYEIGQERKFLPCSHVFHVKCIDMWLKNSSRNCPLDGLPIDPVS